MGFALWIDTRQEIVWARGTHEYRPMGTAAVASSDQFRVLDFNPTRKIPAGLQSSFAGFFGSLETVNEFLRMRSQAGAGRKLLPTPAHLLI